jgi:hypothetical protein
MEWERQYPAEGLTAIEIELRRGDVVVETGPPDKVVLRADSGNSVTEADLRIQQGDGVLRIAQVSIGGGWGGNFFEDLGRGDFNLERLGELFNRFGRIDLRLAVPPSVRRVSAVSGLGSVRVLQWADEARVRTGKGDVTIGAASGRVDVKCGVGAVRVERFGGSCAIQTGMGEVTVGGGEGEARLHTGVGKVQVADATLNLDANTGMGDVRLERVGGKASLRTGLGELRVVGARDLTLDVQTGKGDLRADGAFGPVRGRSGFGAVIWQASRLGSSVELNTGHGEIDFTFATGNGAIRIDAASGRGRIDSDIPLMQVGQPGPEGFFRQRVVGTAGEGEIRTTVRLRSGAGNVRLHRGEAPPAAPAEPVAVPVTASAPPPASAEVSPQPRTRLEILQALSQGQITIEEADRRLREL